MAEQDAAGIALCERYAVADVDSPSSGSSSSRSAPARG
jgi:hypothetical protein